MVSTCGAAKDEIDTAIRRAAGERATLVIAGDARPATLIVYALGLDGDVGRVVVGALRREFPTALEWLVLQATANQANSALRSADLESRHRRNEDELVRLAIARQFAVAMNGDIAVQSQFGFGSTFTVTLPGAA